MTIRPAVRVGLLLPILLLSACGSHEIDGRDVERGILTPDGLPGPRIVQAECPDHVASVPGRHFTCTVTHEDGGTSTMDFTIDNDHGGYSTRINVLGGGLPSPEFGPPVG